MEICVQIRLPLIMPLKLSATTPRLALIQTGCYYLAFFVLGLSTAVVGPTLNNLATHTGSTLGAVSSLFAANALGRTAGSLLSGRIYDRLRGHPIIAFALALVGLSHFVLPSLGMLWPLLAVGFVLGTAEGTMDVGCNTLLMRVHGKNVGPFMNGLHLTFGIGAFIMPLVAAASLKATGDVFGAFWFVSLLVVPLVVIFLRLPNPIAHSEHEAAQARPIPQTSLVAIFVVFFFLFVGVEATPGSWTFSYGKGLGLDEIGAGALNSMFFGGFTLGRLLSIPIATRIKPGRVLVLDIVGLFVGVGLLLLVREPGVLMWLGIGVLGFAVASMFPTALAYAEERFAVTGTITGIFLAASNMAVMFFPWLIGQFFESRGPSVMTIVLALLTVGTAAIFAVLNGAMRKPQSQV